MNLECIDIKQLRSISHSTLMSCGTFNVLIGKNNSGKSNLLSAIDAFFSCITGGNIVTLSPHYKDEIDFHGKNTNLPIEITMSFSLTSSERDALIREISNESPQMRNAIDSVDASLILSITINITPPPSSFGHVKFIWLTSKLRNNQYTILELSNDAAHEIYTQLSLSSNRKSLADALSTIDRSTVRAFFDSRRESRARLPITYLLRSTTPVEIIADFRRSIETLVDSANSPDDLYRELQNLSSQMHAEAAEITSEPLKNRVGTFSGEESEIPKYALNLVTQVSNIKILYLKERRKMIGREEASKLLELKVERGGPEILRNIQQTVESLLGVQIDAFRSKVSSPSSRGELSAEMDVDNFLVQVNGSGIREALRLILDFEFEKPQILLVEEPEVHLHPALEMGLMRYLKRISTDCQVFLTTHSTNFLDTADMKNVYLVSKKQFTDVRLLDIEAAENEIPRELGIRLSSLFMFDRLVFVEGPSDEAVLREWASILGINLSQANVGFIHMDGVRNFTHFATEKTLSFLSKRQVKMWFVLDHDERDEEEIKLLTTRLSGKAALRILSKREIENYLIQPRIISELIQLKQQIGGHRQEEIISEQDIAKVIDETAEKLKLFSIEKRIVHTVCEPIFPSRERILKDQGETITQRISTELDKMIDKIEQIRNKIQEVSSEQEQAMVARWAMNKLSIVPGDILLDLVLRNYKLRFNKDRDSARLASFMHKDEIDSEINSIIRDIGTF